MEEVKTEDKKYCVYMHTNKINNKVYVGQTCDKLTHRWGKHGQGYKTQKRFWRAIQKYGWDNFEHIVFAENLTKEDADHMEKLLIALYQTTDKNKGYNITTGGDGGAAYGENNPFYGKHHTEETKQKISIANTGLRRTDEYRKQKQDSMMGNKNHFYGKHHTDETRRRIREKRLGTVLSQETKDKISNALRNSKGIPVIQLTLYDEFMFAYCNGAEAERQTEVSQESISRCCNDKQGSAGGFHWMFEYKWYELNGMNDNLVGDINAENTDS